MQSGFWNDYFLLLKYIFSFRWIIDSMMEWFLGMFLAIVGSALLAILVSPLWLLFTLPVGITVWLHGVWKTHKEIFGD